MSAKTSLLSKVFSSSISFGNATGSASRFKIGRRDLHWHQNLKTTGCCRIIKRECSRQFLPSLSILTKSNDNSNRKYCTYPDHKKHTIVNLGKGNFEEVMLLFRDYFIPYEPISMGLGATFEDKKAYLENLASYELESGFCAGARNHEGKLIGMILGQKQIKEDPVKDDSAIFAKDNIIMGRTLEIINHVGENYDVFSHQGVNVAQYLSTVMVDPAYSGQGIVRKIMQFCEQKAVEEGIRVAYVVVTGIVSQAISQKNGYETVYEAPYTMFDFLNLKAMGKSTCIKVMVKQLV